jgi:hypothetical protein
MVTLVHQQAGVEVEVDLATLLQHSMLDLRQLRALLPDGAPTALQAAAVRATAILVVVEVAVLAQLVLVVVAPTKTVGAGRVVSDEISMIFSPAQFSFQDLI